MPYDKQGQLGKGGFGIVYEAVDEFGLVYALKEFAPDPSIQVDEGHLKERFRREAVYQQKIDHPNVVKIIEFHDGEVPFIVMELASISLKNYLDNNKDITHEQRVSIIRDMLSGLESVHEAQCTHRDMKPENVLGFPDDKSPTGYRFKISDFGLVAAPSHAETTLTMTGMAGGSTYYASPEAMKSMNRCDARSDIYSMGAIIFDLFIGKPRVPLAHLKAPGEIGKVASRCTETNPSKRYQTIAALREDFLAAADLEEWTPSNATEARYLEILQKDEPTEEEWDELDIDLQELLQAGDIRDGAYPLFRALKSDHLQQLKLMNDGVFRSIANGFSEHVLAARGWFGFDYCDVAAGKLRRVVELGGAEEKAKALLALLILGASHNRYYVERIFGNNSGPSQDDETVDRLILEAAARGEDLGDWLTHWNNSLNRNTPTLHPKLNALIHED